MKVTFFFSLSKGDPLDPSKSTREFSTPLVNLIELNIIQCDLTKEQQAERKSLVELSKSKQAEHLQDSPFRIRVRGTPENMKLVKIDANGKWTVLYSNPLK